MWFWPKERILDGAKHRHEKEVLQLERMTYENWKFQKEVFPLHEFLIEIGRFRENKKEDN